MRATPGEFERIDLRAHSLLAGAALHDVWVVDLPGESRGRTIVDVKKLMTVERLADVNVAVRFLFGLRVWLGRVFGWDREPPQASRESWVHRLSAAERAASLIAPGTPDGPFHTLFVSPHESISEVRNATVHAFSVLALVPRPSGCRFYWAIYVRPVGRFTSWYMRLIDPFRRLIIYPAVLRRVRAGWEVAEP